ncbi:MAG: flagellar biosynthesis protein FlgN [Cryobacterium sp.]|nr:flagellar biosynthesis protein FlgN [Cryobacterium sp.]
MGANELSASIWRERELLELLIFKLEEEQLLLTAGKTRWLQHATREVEQVIERMREANLGLSVEASAVGREWGADEGATLRELIAHAPAGPWGEILMSHLNAMTQLTTEIKGLRDVNEQFLRAAARSTLETLSGLTPDSSTYDSHGATDATGGRARLVDRQL